MKKFLCILLCLISLFSLVSCTNSTTENKKIFETKEDFSDATFGVLVGSALEQMIENLYPNAKFMRYDDESARIVALNKGIIDVICGEKAIAKIYDEDSGIVMFPEQIAPDCFGFGFKKGNSLKDEFNTAINKLKNDGTLKILEDKWLGDDGSDISIDYSKYEYEYTREITVALDCQLPPFTYIGNNGEIQGFDTELLMLIGKELGYKITIQNLQFSSLLQAVMTDKVDVVGGSMSITEERKESIDFTDSYYDDGMYFFVREECLASKDFDLNNKDTVIAVMSDYVSQAEIVYPNATFKYVLDENDLILYLQTGQADAIIEKETLYRAMIRKGITNIKIHSDGGIGEKGLVVAGVSKTACVPNAVSLVNQFIDEIKADGTYDKIKQYWEIDGNTELPEIDMPENPKFTIKVGTTGLVDPYTFYSNGELVGEDIEMSMRFAAWLGADVEFYTYGWDTLAVALDVGDIDFVFSDWYYTEERAETVLLSKPYSDFVEVAIIIDEKAETGNVSFIDSIVTSFERTFIKENRWKLVVNGLLVTLEITLLSMVFGTVIGFCLYLLKKTNKKIINIFLAIYSKIFTGVPSIVLLMFIYFVVFAHSDISPEMASAVAFTLIFSSQCFSLFTTAISTIDRGQIEAATALGFNKIKLYTKIILPQALAVALPIYKGEIVGILKLTSIAGYISTMDLTKAGDIIRSRTYEAFFPLIAIALIYFGLAELIIFLVGRIQIVIKPKANRMPRGVNPELHTIQNLSENLGKGEEIIRLSHIKKVYEKVTPLKDICATINKGDVVTIIGPSGTGKSTLLRMMNALEMPSEGSVFVFGEDLTNKKTDLNKIRSRIGMVFQSFNLFSNMNIIENIMVGPVTVKKVSKQVAYEKGMMLLKQVGLAERALDMPEMLSGGQKQRVAIARALAMEPEAILFDEPTSALDPGMVGEVLTVMKNLARNGLTMIIVTHEMNFARNVSTKIFYLDTGIVYEEGTPDVIFDNPTRNRTRVFIDKIKTLSFTAETKEYDFIKLVNDCEEFANKYRFTEKRKERLLRIAEEVMNIMPFDSENSSKKHMFAEYDDVNDQLCIYFTWEGTEIDILAGADEMVRKLILSSCEEVEKTYEEGRNTIIFKGV